MIDPKKIAEWKAYLLQPRLLRCSEMLSDEEVRAMRALYDAVPALLAEREEGLSLLRLLEWSGEDATCPCCEGYRPDTDPAWLVANTVNPKIGHGPLDCRLAAFLYG